MQTKIEIRGEPYLVTENGDGSWGIVNTMTPTNNFHRKYRLEAGPNGRPQNCSCPHHRNTGMTCKHIEAITEMVDANDREVETWMLEHATKFRGYRFARLRSGAVRYERWEGAERKSSLALDRNTAAKRWDYLVTIGYRFFGAMSKAVAAGA